MATIFIRKNTPELREKIKELGIELCACCRFHTWDWLDYNGENVHGIPPFNPDHEDSDMCRALFLHELTEEDIDCGEDEEKFLKLVKDGKEKGSHKS